jgi:GntR family transcriptional regulator
MSGLGKTEWIKLQIEQLILSGEYPPGSQLPSEPRLAEMFKVSRGTVRLALSEAERDGVVARRSGMGTYVMRQPKQEKIMSFTQQVLERGQKPGTRIIGASIIPLSQAEGRAAEAFRLESEQSTSVDVYRIDRLRYADDRPVARQTVYLLVEDFGRDVLEIFDFTRSIFELFKRYNRTLSWADEMITVRKPTKEEARLLDMETIPTSERLVFVRNRITYDAENLPLEALQSIDRADYFKIYRYRLLTG